MLFYAYGFRRGQTRKDFTAMSHPSNSSAVESSAVELMDHLLNGTNKERFDPFIYQAFKVFLDKKEEIKFNMYESYFAICLPAH